MEQKQYNKMIINLYKKSSLINIDNDHMLCEKLGYRIEAFILQLMDKKDKVTIGLSNGHLVDLLASIAPHLMLPWEKLKFFFVDERFVPSTSGESTYGNYQIKLFGQLPIEEKNIIQIDSNLKSIEECAQDYQTKLQELLTEQDTSFDIILLDMGSDGHTANLFPDHSALTTNEGLVTFVKDSPRPPHERVTLTLKAINQAKYKIAVVTGEVIHGNNTNYPIGQIENLICYLDQAAASKL